MNKYNWNKAFPETPKEFHDKLVSTLNGLEREEKMKKISLKKTLIIAAAVLALGTAAIASSGPIRYITGSSSATPEYTDVPSAQTLREEMGFEPKVLSSFSNGYSFIDGSDVKSKVIESEDSKISVRCDIADYDSFICRYAKDDDKIIFSADCEPQAHTDENEQTAKMYKDIDISYISYIGKYVPTDYELTEQDKKDEADGSVIFSYGTDELESYVIQGVSWVQDGVYYNITAMNSSLDKDGLIAMAQEIIDY